MESVGEFFKQVRETKGLTVDEVASKTRIRADFIKALEDGNFARLPDQVFAKGFVRSYARSLGLDEDDAIQRFVQSAGAFYDKQDERERLKVRQVEEERKRRANRKAVAVAISIAVVTLIFLLSREQASVLKRSVSELSTPKRSGTVAGETVEPGSEAGTPAASPAPAVVGEVPPIPAKPATDPHPTDATGTTSAAVKPEGDAISTSSPASDGPLGGIAVDGSSVASVDEGLVLDLEAVELTWVVVQIDGGSPQEALLRPGEKARWKGQDQFVLTLGNAGGVKALLNGQPQKPFGPSGKVAHDVVLKR